MCVALPSGQGLPQHHVRQLRQRLHVEVDLEQDGDVRGLLQLQPRPTFLVDVHDDGQPRLRGVRGQHVFDHHQRWVLLDMLSVLLCGGNAPVVGLHVNKQQGLHSLHERPDLFVDDQLRLVPNVHHLFTGHAREPDVHNNEK